MNRVEAASGANYSVHKEQPRKFEPIAPVGTNYTPVGKVDIADLRKVPPPAAKPSFSVLPRVRVRLSVLQSPRNQLHPSLEELRPTALHRRQTNGLKKFLH